MSAASQRLARMAAIQLIVVAWVALLGSPAHAFSLFPGENVTVSGGTLQGAVKGDHREFLGIPFAGPPTGVHRFAPPIAPASWTGERAARTAGPPCPQTSPLPGTLNPSREDCLSLDVYTPWSGAAAGAAATAAKKTPVMVWLYGGGYASGSTSQYDPTPLVTKGGVIVVEVNYRVGPFGFLALPGLDRDGSGSNFGLLDQQAGLRWIRQNIGAFGGDASNVTIFGESAGGNSVCQQLASPGAAGLFQRAIVQSGSCGPSSLSGDTSRAAAYATGARYAAEVGCTDTASLVSCLRGKSQADLLNSPSVGLTARQLVFTPTVGDATLPIFATDAFATGRYNQVPILIGGQQDEGRIFVAAFHHLATLGRVTPGQYAAEVRQFFGTGADRVLAQYPAAAYARINRDAAIDLALSQVWTDGLFACSMRASLLALQGNAGQSLYAYEFTDPNPPFAGIDPLMPLGAFHTSDLFYLFSKTSDIPVIHLDGEQQRLADRMISYWTTFARTGTPSSAGGLWPVYSAASPKLMTLSSASSTPTSINAFSSKHQCGFWQNL